MIDVMSYQYPPPPPNGSEMDMGTSGYIPSYSVPSSTSAMDHESSLPLRERRDSLSKSMKLKLSFSTPGVKVQQQPQAPPLQQTPAPEQHSSFGLAGEKRRNKLGYHRTSVACGHCRRRKIRCVPSPADLQGRCINCIRLKKECSFYPVDQQPPVDPRQRQPSRASVAPTLASASPSPAMASGQPSDVHNHPSYQQIAMSSDQSIASQSAKLPGSDPYPPDARLPSSTSTSRAFEYGHYMTNWMPADASPGSSKSGDLNATWRSYAHEPPIAPGGFASYPPHASSQSATWNSSLGAESGSREEGSWSTYPAPLPRSMSFSAEPMSGHSGQYPPVSQFAGHSSRHYDRKSSTMSDMYPPPLSTSVASIEPGSSAGLDHVASLSAGALPPPSYSAWQQPYGYSKQTDGYGGWYGDSGSGQSPGANEHGHSAAHSSQGESIQYPGR